MTTNRNSHSRSDRNYGEDLPDRNGSDIPEQVQWFLSLCELANIYRPWLQDRGNLGGERDNFCEGVTTYWWDHDELEEPTFDMLFYKPLSSDKAWQGWPSQERIAYQKGAIVGYQLAERFKDGPT